MEEKLKCSTCKEYEQTENKNVAKCLLSERFGNGGVIEADQNVPMPCLKNKHYKEKEAGLF